MNREEDKFEKMEGMVIDIYEDFDTGEPIIKDRAVAFLLDTDKKGKMVVVYDKNALKLGMIKVGEPLVCMGSCDGFVTVKDSNGVIIEEKRFLCMGIMGDAVIDEEELMRQGAIRLR